METIKTSIDPDAFDAFEAASWGERASVYHRSLGAITSRVIEPLLDAAGVGSGTRVLDVATGPGYVAAAAAVRGADIVGVDVSAEMISLAHRLRPELEFHRADAAQLPYPDGSYDAVLANFLIPHVGRPEHVTAELVRVLRPGGALAFSTWDVPERARLLGVLVDAVAEVDAPAPAEIPPGPPFFRFSEDSEFVRLLADAGLDDVVVQTVPFTHRVASGDELWDGLLGGTVRLRALVAGQTAEVQARIRAAFDRLVSVYETGEGLDLPVSVKLASGRKPAGS
jgi:SAM-dependent methyltransferase